MSYFKLALKTAFTVVLALFYVVFTVHFFHSYFASPGIGYQTEKDNFFTVRHLMETSEYKKESQAFFPSCDESEDFCTHSCPGFGPDNFDTIGNNNQGFPYYTKYAESWCPGDEPNQYSSAAFTVPFVIDWLYWVIPTVLFLVAMIAVFRPELWSRLKHKKPKVLRK
jgi:hypothetical protein